MRLHRFFVSHLTNVPLKSGNEFNTQDSDLIHQLKDVFRMNAGDQAVLLDGSGFEFVSSITELTKGIVRFSIGVSKPSANMPKAEVVLFAALIKKDKFEWVLEKGTELGVSAFIPVIADRTEKKDLNFERAAKIVREASEQSARGTLPAVYDAMGLEPALNTMKIPFVAFHPEGKPFDKKEILKEKHVGLLIGPEGGWTEREIDFFRSKGVTLYSLGSQILRAETAAVAVSAILLLESEGKGALPTSPPPISEAETTIR